MEHPRDPLAGLASHYHSLNAQLKLAKALPNKGPNLEEAVLQQMDRPGVHQVSLPIPAPLELPTGFQFGILRFHAISPSNAI